MTSTLSAPPAPPGSLTTTPTSSEVLAYLDALRIWSDDLRDALASIDRRAQVSSTPAAFTADLTLALSLWESIDRRYQELVQVWDSGRVLAKELAHIAQLLWGRLPDALGNQSAFSLSEATSLASALEARLSAQLDADTIAGSGAADRIGPLRETLGRCRQLAETLGRRSGEADELAAQLDAALGGGAGPAVLGPAALGPAVDRLADAGERLERDLIKETALRTSVQAEATDLTARVAGLQLTEEQVRAAAEACRAKILHPPRIAVPDVSVIGPVPTIPDGPQEQGAWRAARATLQAYRAKVDQVAAALAEAGRRFQGPLTERAELRGLLEAYRAKAGARGLAEDPSLGQAFERARVLLWRAPCDLAAARPLVTAYDQAVQAALRVAVQPDRATASAFGAPDVAEPATTGAAEPRDPAPEEQS